MTSSPLRKVKSSRSQMYRPKLCISLVCIASLVSAIYIVSEQTRKTQFYTKDKKSHDKFLKVKDGKGSIISRESGNNQNGKQVNAVSIIGERNSGTTWMYEHLNKCFNHSIPIKRRLTRYKHWFQDENVDEKIVNGTLVLAMFRNPFEWIEAMRKKPHHAPKHMFIKNWKEFVTKKWTMNRVGKDLEMTEEEKLKVNICQEQFMYRDLISCHQRPYPEGTFNKTHYSEHQPFYEMKYDGSGKPFDNILELRAAKIRNFVSTKDFSGVFKFWILQYEALVASGTKKIIQNIEDYTGVQSQCEPSPPQKDRKRRRIKQDMISYLMDHIDWEAENMVGYYKNGMRKPITQANTAQEKVHEV